MIVRELHLERHEDRSGIKTIAPGESPVPVTPHITVEFTLGEWLQLANLVYEEESQGSLAYAILNIADDCGLDYANLDEPNPLRPE
jgi:hypothetical protein